MSIGVVLVSVELIMMLLILLFIPGEIAGACFIGFAIGESLGASALRVAGGIFTKIADIGSDLNEMGSVDGYDEAREGAVSEASELQARRSLPDVRLRAADGRTHLARRTL